MTSLPKRMIRELQLHRKSPGTIDAYVAAVAQLAMHYGRSPEKISLEEIRDFLHHLIVISKLAYSSVNQKLAGTRTAWRSPTIGFSRARTAKSVSPGATAATATAASRCRCRRRNSFAAS